MNNLKAIRKAKEMTQQQLADAIGTSKSYISQLESNKRNIKQIQAGTMKRLCDVLDCTADDIIGNFEPEYDDEGKMIVDHIWLDPRYPTTPIAEIDDVYYFIPSPSQLIDNKLNAKHLRPIMTKPAITSTEVPKHWYPMFYGCTRRGGYGMEIRRAITEQEFEEIKTRFKLTEDDISTEFTDVRGAIYGKQYQQEFTAIQIKIANGVSAIALADELTDKGIEASNPTAYRVNIKIK